jgi:hypothetical protein
MFMKAGVETGKEAKKLNLKILFVLDGFSGRSKPHDAGFFS